MLSRLRERLLATNRGVALDVVLVFLAALGVRLCWAAIIPPWLAPDEPAHFAYIAHLVENGEIPQPFVYDNKYPELSPEYRRSCELTLCGQISGLGSGNGRLKYLPVEYDFELARRHQHSGAFRKTSSGASASEYSPLYYALASLPYRVFYHSPILTRVLAVRAVSAWLSALACVFGYLFAFEIYRSRLWGRATALGLAFMPMYAFIGASINNDAAMFLGTSALWWLLARMWVAHELRPSAMLILGAVAGMTILGKPTSAPLVVPAAALIIAKSARRPGGLRFRPHTLAPMAAFALGLTLTYGPWYIYRSVRTRVPPLRAGTQAPVLWKILVGEAPYSFGAYLQELYSRGWNYTNWLFVKTFWATFGWLEVYLSETTYIALTAAIAACALGLIARVWNKPSDRAILLILLASVLFNIAALLVAADYVKAFAFRGSPYGMQGRYFFGTLVPFMLLLLAGLSGLAGERRWVLRAAPIPIVVLQAASFLTILRAYYGISISLLER